MLPRGHRGRHLPRDHRAGEVPRGDAGDHPARAACARRAADRGRSTREDLAPGPARLLRVPEQELGPPEHLSPGLVERLSALEGERPRQLVRALEHERVGASQRLTALVGPTAPPRSGRRGCAASTASCHVAAPSRRRCGPPRRPRTDRSRPSTPHPSGSRQAPSTYRPLGACDGALHDGIVTPGDVLGRLPREEGWMDPRQERVDAHSGTGAPSSRTT